MAHPLVEQLRFTRAEWQRALRGVPEAVGNSIQRVTYHYWFHIGEILAIRQLLDHPNRREFVGNIDDRAPYWARGIEVPGEA